MHSVVGGSGGMLPQENFEISTVSMHSVVGGSETTTIFVATGV